MRKSVTALLLLLSAGTPDYDERYHLVAAITDDGGLLLNDGGRSGIVRQTRLRGL